MDVAAPVLQALVDAVLEGTDAEAAWLATRDGERLRVVAAAGDEVRELVGSSVGLSEGTAGYVVASNQPLALNARAGDPRLGTGLTALAGRTPTTVLCVPCSSGDVVLGAIEAVDKRGGTFSYDDIELATLLATVAGAALAAGTDPQEVASPAELGRELERLAQANPTRYAVVSAAVEALLSNG